MRIRLPFFAGLFLIILRPDMNAEKPFNFEDTPGKLPKEVVPIEYSVRIAPSIDKFTFTGTETVKLNVRRPLRQLVLNALELEVTDASIDGKALPGSAIKIDKKSELLTVTLPSEFAAGEHTLALRFAGKINQQGQGLFYVPYQEHGSGTKKIMLATQFEATDARRFFPDVELSECFRRGRTRSHRIAKWRHAASCNRNERQSGNGAVRTRRHRANSTILQ